MLRITDGGPIVKKYVLLSYAVRLLLVEITSTLRAMYEVTPSKMTWQQGREYCQARGGDLAFHNFDTLDDRKAIDVGLGSDAFEVWYGLHKVEGVWKLIDGTVPDNIEWNTRAAQPDSGDEVGCWHADNSYFGYLKTAGWFDDSLAPALCEYSCWLD